jgi:hypothetical protein
VNVLGLYAWRSSWITRPAAPGLSYALLGKTQRIDGGKRLRQENPLKALTSPSTHDYGFYQ